MTNITPFENNYMAVMEEFASLDKLQKGTDARLKALKVELEKAMDEHGIKSIDNDYLKITRVAASESLSIDIKAMEKKEPKLHAELLEDYPKVTKRKAYVRFTVK